MNMFAAGIDAKTLGNKMYNLRNEHDLNQREFAELLDVHFSCISRWERGMAVPYKRTVEKMADLFCVRFEDLVDNNSEYYHGEFHPKKTPVVPEKDASELMEVTAENVKKLFPNCRLVPPAELKHEEPTIKDSGNRQSFETGAVRDIQEGKGLPSAMPLDIIGKLYVDDILVNLGVFQNTGDDKYLAAAFRLFVSKDAMDYGFILELAKHFEDGAKKYGLNNWKKGIPTDRYIDSAVRHYCKFKMNWTDEYHDRAFLWNLLCCMWTCENKPELNTFNKED